MGDEPIVQGARACAKCGAQYVPGPDLRMVCAACLGEAAPARRSKLPWKILPWYAQLAIVSVFAIVIGGFVHLVHGGGVFPRVILKEEWTLNETFIDMDDYVGHSAIEIVARGDTMAARALVREGLLSFDGLE